MKRLILVFFVLIFFIACNQNASKKGVLDRDKMISLLTDLHLADGYLSNMGPGDSVKQVAANYYNLVYKKHFTDSIQWKNSLEFYSKQPKLLDTMYSQVVDNLNKIQKSEVTKIEKKRLDTDKYNTLKEETNGTLFKSYDVWFFKFATDSYKNIPIKATEKTWFKPGSTAKMDTAAKVDTSKIKGKPNVKSPEVPRKFLKNIN